MSTFTAGENVGIATQSCRATVRGRAGTIGPAFPRAESTIQFCDIRHLTEHPGWCMFCDAATSHCASAAAHTLRRPRFLRRAHRTWRLQAACSDRLPPPLEMSPAMTRSVNVLPREPAPHTLPVGPPLALLIVVLSSIGALLYTAVPRSLISLPRIPEGRHPIVPCLAWCVLWRWCVHAALRMPAGGYRPGIPVSSRKWLAELPFPRRMLAPLPDMYFARARVRVYGAVRIRHCARRIVLPQAHRLGPAGGAGNRRRQPPCPAHAGLPTGIRLACARWGCTVVYGSARRQRSLLGHAHVSRQPKTGETAFLAGGDREKTRDVGRFGFPVCNPCRLLAL